MYNYILEIRICTCLAQDDLSSVWLAVLELACVGRCNNAHNPASPNYVGPLSTESELPH